LGAHQQRQGELGKVLQRKAEISRQVAVREIAMQIMEAVSLSAQELIHQKIDVPVTAALRTIYQDNSLSFSTELERSADRMEVDFRFRRGDEPIPGPILDSEGGGLVDVAGFTLRLCLFRLLGCKGPICLDEPFRQVDKSAWPRAIEFAQQISLGMGIQLFIVSHETAFTDVAGRIIRVVGRGIVRQEA